MVDCHGPCLPHCLTPCPRIVQWTANAAVAYLLACVTYLVLARCTNVGTPFLDSLTQEQRELKAKSSLVRGTLFAHSLAVSTIVVVAGQALGRRNGHGGA